MGIDWRCFSTPWWQQERTRWEAWVTEAGLPLFCRPLWLDAVVARYAPQLRVWVAFERGEPIGALPLVATRWRGLAIWRWLGSDLCPDHLDLIAARRDQPRLWRSFLTAVVPRHAPPLLFWEGIREESALITELWTRGLALWARAPRPVPYLDLTRLPDRASLLSHITPKLRQELAYLERRLTRDAPEARLHEITAPPAIAATLEQLSTLSRAQHGLASAWSDRRYFSLHLQLAPQLAAAGHLGLFTFGPPNTPWAIAYGFRDGHIFRYYQPAFDRRAARYSPAKLLIARIIAQGVKEGWREFDFLLGAEPYKFEWRPQIRYEADWRMGHGLLGRLICRSAVWLK